MLPTMSTFAFSSSATPLTDLIDLAGKTAIVTGGAMGIGRGIGERLHEAGASTVIADLDPAAAEAVTSSLNARREHSALWTETDVGDADAVAAMVAAAVDGFGGVDILVNNAGIYPLMAFREMDVALFERVLRVNLVGMFLCMKAAAEQMIVQDRGGKIINVTSVDAVHPSMVGLAHYDASKHGAWGLTKNVALELSEHGIAVNAIAPGAVATPGTGVVSVQGAIDETVAGIPMRRMADPDEMGRVALFLASDLASYMTGSQVVADGGMLLR
jgi:Dehydrogenases with different specificities (related to short-chain alcohol dehydrogenases)